MSYAFRSKGVVEASIGVIDEARIYNRALAPAEILALYNEAACQ